MQSTFQKSIRLSLLYLVFGIIFLTAGTNILALQQYETIQLTIPNSENKTVTLTSGSLPSGLTLKTTAQIVSTLTGSGTQDTILAIGATFSTPTGIVKDSSGNIFVVDSGNHLIRKITPDGIVSTFAGSGEEGNNDGNGTSASFDTPSGIAIDSNNNLFIADTNNHLIRKITPSGSVSTFAGNGEAGNTNNTTGILASFNFPKGLAINSSGTLFIADSENNLIRKITSAGAVSTFAGSGNYDTTDGTGINASFYSPSGITIDKNGVLYVADTGNNLIRKITSTGVVSTIDEVIDDENSIPFSSPSGIAVDTNLNIYITDTDNNLIRKITSTGVVSTFAGSGEVGNDDSSIDTIASFNTPTGLFIDSSGSLYIADSKNNTIRKITPAGDVSTIAGSGEAGNTNGMAIVVIPTVDTSDFLSPNGIATDSNGNIFIADTSNNVIKKIGVDGIAIVFAGNGETGSDDGNSTTAKFNAPSGIAIDTNGNLYVADTGNNKIRKITSAGEVSTIAGKAIIEGGDNSGSTDATGTAASFYAPKGIVVDSTGTNLYVADTFNNKIRKIVIATKVVSTLAGKPITYDDGFPSDNSGALNGTGTAASFFSPSGIAINSTNDTLYVTDTDNHLIRKITISSKAVTTLAGISSESGNTNGTGTAASFYSPTGITLDSNGDILVTDSGNNTIRKITPAGVVTTIAGSSESSSGLEDGNVTNALFDTPNGIATTPTGYIYIADTLNNKIRKVAPPHSEIFGSIATAGTYSFTLSLSGGGSEIYTITVEPKCSSYEKEVSGVCIAKTCKDDGFDCPSCDDSYQTLAYNTDGSGYCAINTYTISYLPSNTTMGEVTSNQSGTSLEWGTVVTLTAIPKEGYKFISWSDGLGSAERNETISEALTLTALFQAKTCQEDGYGCLECTSYQTLQYNQNGSGYCQNNSFSVGYASTDTTMGTISATQSGNSFEWGTTLTLIAQPKEGFKFVSWNDGNTTNPRDMHITKDINVTATFIAKTCRIDGYGCTSTCSVNQQTIYFNETSDDYYCLDKRFPIVYSTELVKGSIALKGGNTNYSSGESFFLGTELTLTATPKEGYKFISWRDGNTTNPRVFKVTSDTTFIADFEAKTCAIDEYNCLTRNLSTGWNLISLPITTILQKEDFDSTFGADSILWNFDNNTPNKWFVYAKDIVIPTSINSLETIQAGEGFWIKSTSPKTLKYDSKNVYDITSIVNLQNLTTGWHLLGTGTTKTIDAIKQTNTNIQVMWKYKNGAWQTTHAGALPTGITSMANVEAGEGFWVLVK